MSVSDKVRAALALRGKANIDAAVALDISPQAFNNKLNRNSFSMCDIIRLAEAFNFDIALSDARGQRVVFTVDDVSKSESE